MAAGGGGRGEQRTGRALLPFHAPRAICVRQHGHATVTHLRASRQRERKEENDGEKKRERRGAKDVPCLPVVNALKPSECRTCATQT